MTIIETILAFFAVWLFGISLLGGSYLLNKRQVVKLKGRRHIG